MHKYIGNGEFELSDEEIIVQCECGKVWAMDFEPAPDACLDSNWRLRVGQDWGIWVDKDGNEVQIEEESEGGGVPEVRE